MVSIEQLGAISTSAFHELRYSSRMVFKILGYVIHFLVVNSPAIISRIVKCNLPHGKSLQRPVTKISYLSTISTKLSSIIVKSYAPFLPETSDTCVSRFQSTRWKPTWGISSWVKHVLYIYWRAAAYPFMLPGLSATFSLAELGAWVSDAIIERLITKFYCILLCSKYTYLYYYRCGICNTMWCINYLWTYPHPYIIYVVRIWYSDSNKKSTVHVSLHRTDRVRVSPRANQKYKKYKWMNE